MNRLLIPALGATLVLGACQGREASRSAPLAPQAPRYVSIDAALDAGTASPQRRASPVALLPAWIGKPIRLRENDEAETFEQVVSLGLTPRDAPRENLVMVALPRSSAARQRLLDSSAAVMGKPTEAGIRSELAAVFPGLAMQVVTRPTSNAYGPYGLAIGRGTGRMRCLYAWQWIEEAPALDAGRSAPGPLSLRVQLCRDDITLEAMAAAVNQMKLVPRFEGASLASGEAAPHTRSHRSAHRARPVRRRLAQADTRPSEPAETQPLPLARSVEAAPARSAPDMSGRRYLGADPVAAAAHALSRPIPDPMRGALAGLGGPAPAASAGGIAADLPPEAYRGPRGALP